MEVMSVLARFWKREHTREYKEGTCRLMATRHEQKRALMHLSLLENDDNMSFTRDGVLLFNERSYTVILEYNWVAISGRRQSRLITGIEAIGVLPPGSSGTPNV